MVVNQVNHPVVIVADPLGMSVEAGTAVTFRVQATGTDPVHYQWRLNAQSIPGANAAEYTLSNAQSTNADTSDVVVTNMVNSVTSAGALPVVTDTLQGLAHDGYLAGATVFMDANLNSVLDPGKPFAKTDDHGNFDLKVEISLYDRNHNGKVDPDEGRLTVVDGLDIATELPLKTALTAPVGSTVLNPLTTLVQTVLEQNPGMETSQAQQTVQTVLGIPNSVDLVHYDPLAGVSAADPVGVSVLKAAAELQDAIVQAAVVSDATPSQSQQQAATTVIAALAN